MTRPLRFGLQIPSFTYPGGPGEIFETVATAATTAEEAGFDTVLVMDHFYQIGFVGRSDEPMLEAYTLLGALAARTRTVRLGTLVTGVTYRNPAMLAKIVTTLDVISGGRALLGIGAAWNDEEHTGYGFRFPGVGERMERLEEALEICRVMFAGGRPSFSGRHYHIDRAYNEPGPISSPHPPILVGGGGERRTLRLAARYADITNFFGDPSAIAAKLAVLRGHCEREGRDPSELTNTTLVTVVIGATADDAARTGAEIRARRGLDEATYRASHIVGDPGQVGDQLAAYFAAGLDGIIVNLPDAHRPETVALLGATLTERFGPGA